jgi:hypothetical protein
VRKVVNAVPETARSWGWVVRVSELEAEGTAGPLVSQEDRFFEEQVESLEAAGLHDIAQHLRKRRAEGYA